MDKPPITVMIVEDQDITRLGLKLVLDQTPGIEVVAEAGDGAGAIQMALQKNPKVVLMDVGLPGMDGIAATRAIKKEQPSTRIVMFTSHDEDQSVFAAFAAGADGYCLKDAPQDSIIAAVQTVSQGNAWLDRNIAGKVLSAQAQLQEKTATESAKPDSAKTTADQELLFTGQEMSVLRLIVDGCTTREIALSLGVDLTSCQSLMRQLMEKLERSHQAQSALSDLRGAIGSGKSANDARLEEKQLELRQQQQQASLKQQRSALLMAPGSIFADRYEIISIIGKGGVSFVYKAKHKHIGRLVAIKTLRQDHLEDETLARRFEREAQAAAALEHPNIIQIYDFGVSSNGQVFLVMDYLEGMSLEKFIADNGPLSRDQFMNVFLPVLDALAFAHDNKVLHRDMKPANIMLVTRQNDKPLVKLVDFGIARVITEQQEAEAKLTRAGEVVGTPLYMSPEQYMGHDLDPRSDLYSLGCTMYEAITGVAAFGGGNLYQILARHMNEYPVPPSEADSALDIASDFDAVIMSLLEKDPDKRPQSAYDTKRLLTSAFEASVAKQ